MYIKKYFFSLILIFSLIPLNAQVTKIDSSYNNTYFQGRMALFKSLPKTSNAVVFLGNSITERGSWCELLPNQQVVNRGIGGDNTFGVLARLNDVLDLKPEKIFLLIGINDIGRGIPLEVIVNNYEKILAQIKNKSPKTKVYFQSVLPMNDDILTAEYLKGKKSIVKSLNERIKKLSQQSEYEYVDLYYEVFSDGDDNLKADLTSDGIHLNPKAYVQWVDFLKRKNYL